MNTGPSLFPSGAWKAGAMNDAESYALLGDGAMLLIIGVEAAVTA